MTISKFCSIQVWLFLLLAPLGAGAETYFDRMQAGETVYREVKVREVSAKWIVIVHSGGIAQVALSQLSPELQAFFGYDAEHAKEFQEAVDQRREVARRTFVAEPVADIPLIPDRRWETDLRPQFFRLGLHTKNQGRRPSCSIFAILSVMEFHYSLGKESAFFLSEEFLIWATRQINPGQSDFDGFSFAEVIAAIQHYGVASGEVMPNTFGVPITQIIANEEVQAEAASRRDVLVKLAIGSKEAKIEEILRELNEGFPVAISLGWPPDGIMARVHTLRDQSPREGFGHAVSVVGYHRPDRTSDEILFLFRNSYGPQWGMGGYGFVSDRYLRKNLHDVLSMRLRN